MSRASFQGPRRRLRRLARHAAWIAVPLFWLLFNTTWSQTSTDKTADTGQPAAVATGIKPLPGPLDSKQVLAQDLVFANNEVRRKVIDSGSGKALRSAVFQIDPARDSDLPRSALSCRQSICYRVDIYNYAFNASFRVIVDVARKRVVAISEYARGQPQVPAYLTRRALEIAVNSPKVIAALGFKPEEGSAVMADVQTALNHTQCESSRHLCVAPTFVFTNAQKALWAIVDLTDGDVAGVQWTHIGATRAIKPTEESIQRENVYQKYCRKRQTFEKGKWKFEYIITSSDGLEISDVYFGKEKVLDSAKLVDWHVSYSEHKGFGYSDAIGCPEFSSAAVGALTGPQVSAIGKDQGEGGGFAMEQDFHHPLWPAPCNYRYTQRFEFYDDGRFRVAAGQYGRGCGLHGMYRPVLRIKPALGPKAEFAEWTGSGWSTWKTEQWRLQDSNTRYTKQGYQYRMEDQSKGWYVEPGTGQFPDNRGDHAYVYVTRAKPGEGDTDMITIGPCCNDDYRQGPEQFIDNPPEALDKSGFVLWYVPQLAADARGEHQYCWAEAVVKDGLYEPESWPCYGGPMFVPVDSNGG
ncbi:MAG: hypothetical protein WB783_07155 [Arenicellales bacterium]